MTAYSCARLGVGSDDDIIRPELDVVPDRRLHMMVTLLTGLLRHVAVGSVCHSHSGHCPSTEDETARANIKESLFHMAEPNLIYIHHLNPFQVLVSSSYARKTKGSSALFPGSRDQSLTQELHLLRNSLTIINRQPELRLKRVKIVVSFVTWDGIDVKLMYRKGLLQRSR